MRRAFRILAYAAVLLGMLAGCTSLYFKDAGIPPSAPPKYQLKDWPYAEYWTGIIFNGEKVGYAHVQVTPSEGRPDRFEIRSQSLLRIRMLGFDKRITLESVDRVKSDLTLEWFAHRYDLDGSRLDITGEVAGNLLNGTVDNAGRVSRIALPLDEPVFPASAATLIPVHRGLQIGAEYRFPVFSGRTQSIVPAEQKVEAYESSELFVDRAYRVSSGFLGLSSTTWRSSVRASSGAST